MMFYDDLAKNKIFWISTSTISNIEYQAFCVRAQSVKCIEELTEGKRKPVWKPRDV